MIIQSVIFKRAYGVSRARDWLAKHGYGTAKVDITPEHIRFRQYDPYSLERMGYHFITQKFKHGSFVIAYPPAKK